MIRACSRAAAALLLLARLAAAEEPPPDGAALYERHCAACHGPQGAGTAQRRQRLEGGLSVLQLADLIGRTMPEDDPGSLSVEQNRAIAAYIHEAFYSAAARERNRPARIETSRLTARQHRAALADLFGSFREPPRWTARHGLLGEYFAGRRLRDGRRVAERLDAQVKFDFGVGPPAAEVLEPREYSIRWSGALLAPDTGEYEFSVRTEHAVRLWVNDSRRPVIDAWVRSGDETEHSGSLFLLGGRPYRLRLEFTKAKQGVDDSAQQKEKPPSAPASIALCWKRPQRTLEPIPARWLSTDLPPEVFLCTTPFPPEDRSYGWERGVSVSKAWDQAATDAALQAAAYLTGRVRYGSDAETPGDDPGDTSTVVTLGGPFEELVGLTQSGVDREQAIRGFCHTFAERAFRRPLSDELAAALIDRQLAAAPDALAAVNRICLLVLKSPRFLFRELGSALDDYDIAARLSFGLWDSLPDGELREAAAAGRLSSAEEVGRQAERLLADPRAQARLREFLLNWLKASDHVDVEKDVALYPGFDAPVVSDLKTSLELALQDMLGSPTADFRQLLATDQVYLNGRLALWYGVDLPAGADFRPVSLDAGRRAGVVTHPYLLARFARRAESSPIHRGVLLARGVLGQSLKPPPEAVTPIAADLHPDLTTRERVALQTEAATCMTCHGIINPLGFTLEHFDAIGRYREEERGKRVDATGSYVTRSGEQITLRGGRALGEFLSASPEAHTAFIEQLFHALVQQAVRAYGPDTLDRLREGFQREEYNIRRLAAAIMVASALARRDTANGGLSASAQ